MATEFASCEPEYQSAKTYRGNLRKLLIEYVKGLKYAFVGNEKSYHIKGGVVVPRSEIKKVLFDTDKMNSAWLKAILATPSAEAIKVSIDPAKLLHDAVTDTLLDVIDYCEETEHRFSVATSTVSKNSIDNQHFDILGARWCTVFRNFSIGWELIALKTI